MLRTTHSTASLVGDNRIVLDVTDVIREHCSTIRAENVHLELVFRFRKKLDIEDLAAVQRTINNWVATIAGGDATIPFELAPYGGGRFARIEGPLRDLCAYVRSHHDARRCTEATAYAPYVSLQ